jgi:hypothetical protein
MSKAAEQSLDGRSSRAGKALVDVVDGVESGIEESDGARVTIGQLVTSLNDRGFGVLCAIIGALAATPVIGGLPGVSVGTGLLVLLVAGQYVFGRNSPWIPSLLGRRSFDRDSVEAGLRKVRPYARWIDKLVEPRLTWLVAGDRERRVIATAMCLLALTMFPLALVPWGVFPAALAITAFGIAITGRDGVFALLGYALLAVTAYLIYAFSNVVVSFL